MFIAAYPGPVEVLGGAADLLGLPRRCAGGRAPRQRHGCLWRLSTTYTFVLWLFVFVVLGVCVCVARVCVWPFYCLCAVAFASTLFAFKLFSRFVFSLSA